MKANHVKKIRPRFYVLSTGENKFTVAFLNKGYSYDSLQNEFLAKNEIHVWIMVHLDTDEVGERWCA